LGALILHRRDAVGQAQWIGSIALRIENIIHRQSRRVADLRQYIRERILVREGVGSARRVLRATGNAADFVMRVGGAVARRIGVTGVVESTPWIFLPVSTNVL
jgi:hypothetical protein